MQVVLADGIDKRSVFFMIGLRAPVGSTAGPNGTNVERVGVVIRKQRMRINGTWTDSDVLTKDEVYGDTNPDNLLRFESDLSTTKPQLDLVVVDDVASDPNLFHEIVVTRATGTNTTHQNVKFGWIPRNHAPRLPLAGSVPPLPLRPPPPPPLPPEVLAPYGGDKLAMNFDNAFFNGNPPTVPTAEDSRLEPGDRIVFDDGAVTTTVNIPTAPELTITHCGADVMTLVPLVDTVVFDKSQNKKEFLISWRAVFAWERRFEAMTLEVA